MSRTRTVVLAAAAAALVVAGIAYGASAGGAGSPAPGGGAGTSLDDSVFAAALGGIADDPATGSGADQGTDGRRSGPGRMGLGLRHGGPMIGMGQWILHGESVVKDRGGSFVTVAVQSGEITAVDGTTMTVKSEDGYSRTWALTDATKYWSFPDGASKADLEVGLDVRVAGSVTDGAAKARLVWIPPKPGTVPQRPHQSAPGTSHGPADKPAPQPSASTSSA